MFQKLESLNNGQFFIQLMAFQCFLIWSMSGPTSTSWSHPGLASTLQSLEIFPTPIFKLEITLTAGQGPIPTGPAIISHDACEGGVALEHVACFTVERHCGAQFVVTTQPGAVHHIAWIEAWLPKLGFMRKERGKEQDWLETFLHYTFILCMHCMHHSAHSVFVL